MKPAPAIADDLRNHLDLCKDLLSLTQRENQELRDPSQPSQFTTFQGRKSLLPKITSSVAAIRRCQVTWRAMSPAERAQHPEIMPLLRQSQDLIMKILVLDRENEQCLLRRGLVPAQHLSAVATQRPHFVADLYRRNALSSANAD